MKVLCLALIGLASALAVVGQEARQLTNATQIRFKYELYTAQNGALRAAATGNTHANDLVHAVFVDSKGWVFVGTQNGLAVYDGKQWTNRTFRLKGQSLAGRAVLGLMGISECGPEKIAEGPPGTIWLGGSGCGVWRFREGRYDEIGSSPLSDDYLGMAVDNGGSLWVVTRQSVQKYDGRAWSEVLSPYVTGKVHRELPQLFGMVVGTNGSVWIGGTVYGDPQAPWEHDGAIWIVDQERRKRADGPPMAGLYEFNGKGWRAFGPSHGLGLRPRDTVVPELDGQGRVTVKTRNGIYIRDGENWSPVTERDAYAGRRWVLRALGASRPAGYFAELLFRDGDRLVPVRPTDQQTGEVLDFGSEPVRVLRMAEDPERGCIWLGTMHGLYRIWLEKEGVR
jgi:ligand-binding sensor domain-containing protein